MATKRTRGANPALGRDEWIAAARTALVERGVESIKVDVLARALGVTGGSFYWHYRDRADLLDALLENWRHANNEPWFAAVAAAGDDPYAQFEALVAMWIDETGFSAAYDSAVRDWARTSPVVETAVRDADRRRIALLADIYRRFGYADEAAFVRARIAYFHQVGYYALRITESRAERRRLKPLYYEGLLGADVMRRYAMSPSSANTSSAQARRRRTPPT